MVHDIKSIHTSIDSKSLENVTLEDLVDSIPIAGVKSPPKKGGRGVNMHFPTKAAKN